MIKTIVTGQQIGLLGGPLYTTYKVLGTISLARKLKGKAIYWLETNDADFNEINYIDYLDVRGKLRSLKWDKNSRGYSCGLVRVDKKLVTLIDQFFDTIRQTEFTEKLRKLASNVYEKGKNLGDASRELACSLFGSYGVEIFDPRDRNFVEASRDLLLMEASRTASGNQCNLFCIIKKKRVAVFRKDSGFCDRQGKSIDLKEYDLVPNVKTRNVIQDRYFNTHTYVAGPAEMDYIGNLDDMYAYHQVQKPIILPRMSITLVEPKVRRILDNSGWDVQDVLEKRKEDFRKLVRDEFSGFDHQVVLEKSRKLTENYLREMEKLELNIKMVRRVLEQSIKEMVGRRRAEAKKDMTGLWEKINYLYDNLHPFGKKQERAFNLFYYMNLFGGLEFIDWLFARYDFNSTVLEIKNET